LGSALSSTLRKSFRDWSGEACYAHLPLLRQAFRVDLHIYFPSYYTSCEDILYIFGMPSTEPSSFEIVDISISADSSKN
jgi:hypothetical protein